MQTELPTPKVSLEDAIKLAIAASGHRAEELCGISAYLAPAEDSYPFRWEVGVEPFSMRHLDPGLIRIQVNAETGATSTIEMR